MTTVMKNWMTSIAGGIIVLVALGHCYSSGMIDVQCVINVLIGGGLIAAKDSNVTGGTRQQ